MNIRQAVMEGRFYPASKGAIFTQIRKIETEERYPESDVEATRVLGAVLPHAGHIYSGHQTIPLFKLIRRLEMVPETFIIVHPNHTGFGEAIAIDESDVWSNSVGEVSLDREFALAMGLPIDGMAHAKEHSAEVIVPFLQYYLPDHPFSIVPVCMREQGHSSAVMVAQKILQANKQTGRNIMVLASCDFSHFLPPDLGKEKDQHVIDEILNRNTEGVETAVKRHRVSVCGYGPIMVLMDYAGNIDRNYRIKVLARGDSGEVTQSSDVVDYISLIMYQ